jgi:hypothetical protein
VLHPVHDEGTAPFLRAVGSADFQHLASSHHATLPTAVSSHLRPEPRTEPPLHGRSLS